MAEQQQTVEDLGKLVKSKYPHALYRSMPDIEVGRKVKAKYPRSRYAKFADITEPKKVDTAPAKKEEPGYFSKVWQNITSGDPQGVAAFNEKLKAQHPEENQPPPKTPLTPFNEWLAGVMRYVPDPIAMAVPGEGAAAGLAGIGKRAIGLGLGAGAGIGVREGAKAVGAPEWVSDLAAGAAGIWVASKISPQAAETLESLHKLKGAGAVKSFVKGLIDSKNKDGETLAAAKFIERFGHEPATLEEKAQAKILLNKWVREQKEVLDPKPKLEPKSKGTPPPKLQGSSLQRQKPNLEPKPKSVKPPPLQGSSLQRQLAAEESGGEKAETTTPVKSPKPKESSGRTEYKPDQPGTTGYTARDLDLGNVANRQALVKNKAMATRLLKTKTPDEIARLTEAEYNKALLEENAERSKQGLGKFEKPRPGVNRRTFEELRADLVRTAKELKQQGQ